MTAGLGQRSRGAALESGPARVALAVTAVLAGLLAGWLTAGSAAMLAAMAVLLAAGNGYAKAYSP